MGSVKQEWIEHQEQEPMYDWIAENYGYILDDEYSEDYTQDEWDEAVLAYEDYCERHRLDREAEWLHHQEELEWYMYTQSQKGKFDTQMRSVLELVNVNVADETKFSLLVMLHGHTVAAVESYLASTFIHNVTNSEDLIRKLVESDPEFSKRRFTLKEIYEKQETLKLTVANYLKDLIFHKLDKVKPMFNDVLECDFGDIGWLFQAVEIRHHCVHRAGLDKDENKVELSSNSIIALVKNSQNLVNSIESMVEKLPS